jgi:uncharacterized protein involved in exopolysaccharide biosynthesis
VAGALAVLGSGSLPSQGLNPTPEFVAALLTGRGVLTSVGQRPSGAGAGATLVEALRGRSVAGPDIPAALRRHLQVRIARETGLITVTTAAPDSSVAREFNRALVAEMTKTFVATVRAQAQLQRVAQAARQDSAAARVDRADAELRRFLGSNRVVAEYSSTAAARDRLVRALDLAHDVYRQASADYESAVARELQETPAVVIVDPVPTVLPKRPRYLLLKTGLALFAGLLFGIGGLYLSIMRSEGGLVAE